MKQCNWSSACDGLDPRRKRVPSCGSANWQANLLDKNQKRSCPQCRTMHLMGRPQIVCDQQHEKDIRRDCGVCGIMEKPTEGKAGYGSNQDPARCQVDYALVS